MLPFPSRQGREVDELGICKMVVATPSKKDVVVCLMEFVGKEGKTEDQPAYVIYRCPKEDCVKKCVRFREGSGFSNPYRHLRTCYGRGRSSEEQEEILLTMYNDAIEAQGGTCIPTSATKRRSNITGTPAEKRAKLAKGQDSLVGAVAENGKSGKTSRSGMASVGDEVNYRTPVAIRQPDARKSTDSPSVPTPVESETENGTGNEAATEGAAATATVEVIPATAPSTPTSTPAPAAEPASESAGCTSKNADEANGSGSASSSATENGEAEAEVEVEKREAYKPADPKARLRTLKEKGVSKEHMKKLLAKELGEMMAAFLVSYDEHNVEMFNEFAQFIGEFFRHNLVQGWTLCAMNEREVKELVDAISHYFKHNCPGGKPIGLEVNLRCFIQAMSAA